MTLREIIIFLSSLRRVPTITPVEQCGVKVPTVQFSEAFSKPSQIIIINEGLIRFCSRLFLWDLLGRLERTLFVSNHVAYAASRGSIGCLVKHKAPPIRRSYLVLLMTLPFHDLGPACAYNISFQLPSSSSKVVSFLV